jgi:hypothetical protein
MKEPHHGRQDKVLHEQIASHPTVITVEAKPDARLFWDYATVDRMLASDRPPARARLEAMLGKDLTRALLTILTADPTHQSSLSQIDAA